MTFESELQDKYDLITRFYFDRCLNQLGNNFFLLNSDMKYE